MGVPSGAAALLGFFFALLHVFPLTVLLYALVGSAALAGTVFPIIAAVRAIGGEWYETPLFGPFIRLRAGI